MADFTAYTTLADVKNYPTSPITDAENDTQIQSAIDAAQNLIDAECRWSFHNETRTNEELFFPQVKISNDGYLNIRVDKCPVTAVTSISYRFAPNSAWTTLDASLIEFYPTPTAVAYPRANSNLIVAYTNLYSYRANGDKCRVKITYAGGWSGTTPPESLRRFATRLAYWLFRQADAPFEKTANPALGTVTIPSAMPPDLRMLFDRWRRWA